MAGGQGGMMVLSASSSSLGKHTVLSPQGRLVALHHNNGWEGVNEL